MAAGKRVPPPTSGGRELSELALAMDAMRAELDGKQYVERYVQALTHELKSPLAALRGAGEMLGEADLPPAERALRAGSLGYIMKEEAIEKVLTAIRHVIAGEIFLSDRMKGRLLNQLVGGRIKQGSSSIDSLSDRELEVFRLIGEGRGTRQIAEELRLSVRTVEAYREYIKDKLNLKNGTELVQHAFQYVHSGLAA